MNCIKDNFWFGAGIDTLREYYPNYKTIFQEGSYFLSEQFAHNESLQILAELGIFAFGAVVVMMVYIIKFFIKNERKDWYIIGTFASVFSIITHSFFEFNLHTLAISTILILNIGCITTQPILDTPRGFLMKTINKSMKQSN